MARSRKRPSDCLARRPGASIEFVQRWSPVKAISTSFIVIATVVIAGLEPGAAQTAPKSKGPATTAQSAQAPAAPPVESAAPTNAPPPGWLARCSSASRDAPLECAIEQQAVLTRTGQLVVLVNIRVPSDTHAPVALVQLPLGMNLPAGAKLQVDDGKATDLQIQTCESRGCYASAPVAPDMLAALKGGKQLNVSFQTLAKETIKVPMSLADFAAAYDKIK
ncbi:MAG: invasion associated locus B family protein [Bradyrhizobium sp.]|nr:invasion associated locus B family protein [Bradyrhizobium sp.]